MKKLFAIIVAAGAAAILAVSVSMAVECNKDKKCCQPSSASSPAPSASQDPTKQEVVVDPVCGMDVTVGKDTPSHEYKGKAYYFCSKSCKDSFAKDPSRYIGGTSK